MNKTRVSKEEFARCGDEIYSHDIDPRSSEEDEGGFAAIVIGAFEINANEFAVSDRLWAHCPNAQIGRVP